MVFRYLPASPAAEHYSSFVRLIVIPAGISFWTFEALGYLFDVYRGEDLDPTLLEFCLFLSFWPTVLSGPVCRLPDLLPKLRSRNWEWDDLSEGSRQIVVGLFLKVVLAQILSTGLDPGSGVDSAL